MCTELVPVLHTRENFVPDLHMCDEYSKGHFHAPHHVFGILFLKQSEMLLPCQLLNNLSNHVFNFNC